VTTGGAETTVTVTVGWFVGEHAGLVAVSVYVVVTAGLATGVQEFGSERPAVGDHEQFWPPAPVSGVEPPGQIVAVPVATAVGGGTIVTRISFEIPGDAYGALRRLGPRTFLRHGAGRGRSRAWCR
jgi:hypothetical protein